MALALLTGSLAFLFHRPLRVWMLQRQLAYDEHQGGATARAKLVALLGPAAPRFFRRLLHSPDRNTRLAAAEVLLEGPDPLAVVPALLGDYDGTIRLRAVESAGRALPDPRAEALVVAASRDIDGDVRATAVAALYQAVRPRGWRSPLALAALARAVDDPRPDVQSNAMAGMRAVAGRHFGYRLRASQTEREQAIARWRRWWANGLGRKRVALPEPRAITRADLAPPFDVTDLDGRRWTLAALRGQLLVLHFFGSW